MKTTKKTPYIYAQAGHSFGRWLVWAARTETLEDEEVVGYYQTEQEAVHAKFEILADRRVPKSTASTIIAKPRMFVSPEMFASE